MRSYDEWEENWGEEMDEEEKRIRRSWETQEEPEEIRCWLEENDEEELPQESNDLKGAIVFLPTWGKNDSLMFQEILFTPAVVWCVNSLQEVGVDRFLAVCRPSELERAKKYFPPDTCFITNDVDSAQALENLETFLEETEGCVLVLTEPVFFNVTCAEEMATETQRKPGDRSPFRDVYDHYEGASRVSAKQLLEKLREQRSIGLQIDFLHTLLETGTNMHSVCNIVGSDREHNEAWAKKVTNLEWSRLGVFMMDPKNTYIAPTVKIAPGVTILPGTILRGNTKIGSGCEIGPNTMLTDVEVGENTTINASQCNQCTIGSNTTVGPFAYIRPNTHVGDRVKVGDFVELKNSNIGEGTKISHLTYVGDSDVGKNINFGCGTVTVNYDGSKKYRTVIDDDAFIGCNTNLVAPVHVGRGAYTGAGSTINQDVPPDSLAIARSRQSVKKQWAAKRRGEQK